MRVSAAETNYTSISVTVCCLDECWQLTMLPQGHRARDEKKERKKEGKKERRKDKKEGKKEGKIRKKTESS